MFYFKNALLSAALTMIAFILYGGKDCHAQTIGTGTVSWDYSAATSLDVRGGALYIVEIQVDYGDGSGFQTIEDSPYIPR